TDEGSGTPTVETSGGNWVTITEPVEGGTKYVYELDTDGIDTGVEYLIVANSYEKALSAAASSNNAVDIEISGNYAYADSDTYGWTFTRYSNGVYYIRLNGSTYLTLSNNAIGSSNSTGSSRRWTVSSNGDGSYDIVRSNYNLRWSNSNGVFQVSSSNEGPVRLYKYVKTETTNAQAGLYGKISGELTYNVAIGTSEADALAAVKAGIDILYHTGDANAAQTFPDDGEGMTWTLDESYDGITPGEYAVTIAYNGVVLGVAKVVVPSVAIKGYSVDPLSGTVFKGSSQTAQPGSTITVTLEDGSYYTVPVTVAMLKKADGSAVSTGVAGTYENLTLTYNGVVISMNYTLVITEKVGDDYPEYPDEGAVKVNKTAIGIDFQTTGVAKVELSASGVPVKKGADVIVILDTSSSMNSNSVTVNGVTKTRLEVLEESLQSMLTQLQADGADGAPMDIRIAVADFNRYYTNSDSPYYINSADTVGGGSIRTDADGTNIVYTGSKKLDADAFVDVHTLAINAFENLSYTSGTNYDYAFDAAYQLGEAITAENATVGEDRDLFVVFMSDGAPFQYNYFSSQSSGTGAADWNDWLQGTLTTDQFDDGANQTYYNADGKHWMAEAIKGDPNTTYPVIRKNNVADTDGDTWVDVNGLGATMFSIGFCLAADKEITVDSMDAVIRNIASSTDFYFRADTAESLASAFASIGNEITYAAYGARFVDTMGESFDLQLSTTVEGIDNEGKPTTITLPTAPAITVLNYDIWTRAEYESGACAENMIGMRKGTSTVLETVTFNEAGTEAYSNGGTTNILIDGVICADSFWYNTTASSVMIDTNGDGVDNYELAPETFYWNIGAISNKEIALSYYVYLEGSQEGEREEGAYETNESAILYYTNYLGTENCEKHTVSPKLAWESANVSYGFYLVDDSGNPIVNQATGQTGTFANAVRVTSPQLYNEILLNNLDQVNSINVASLGVLPEGYTLYDEAATYTIVIKGDSTGSWTIVKSDDLVKSTYVTQFSTTLEYSNELFTEDPSYDFTHTIVWFAVKFEIKPIPDTVVIDYGLSVDISALANDMFGGKGTLSGVGSTLPTNGYSGGTIANGFGTTLNATYGTAEVNATNGTIKYTPNTMQMPSYDRFAYAVNYTGSSNAGYYYSLVTVIPATSVYYEDNGGWITYGGTATWSDAADGTVADTQGEDRPGTLSLSGFDANNIYGYDGSYDTMSAYSNGSAKKVTVDANSYATAEFSFWGTGFDVISMTSSQTGVLVVQVKQ
ncbi:MAG: RICIN domain-containing protein, partial [Clostridia bacterium]|nr:RICIN domain-containing protein [Clostridia bacterium]